VKPAVPTHTPLTDLQKVARLLPPSDDGDVSQDAHKALLRLYAFLPNVGYPASVEKRARKEKKC